MILKAPSGRGLLSACARLGENADFAILHAPSVICCANATSLTEGGFKLFTVLLYVQ